MLGSHTCCVQISSVLFFVHFSRFTVTTCHVVRAYPCFPLYLFIFCIVTNNGIICISPLRFPRRSSCCRCTAWLSRRIWRSGAAPISAQTTGPTFSHNWRTCRSTTAGASPILACSGAYVRVLTLFYTFLRASVRAEYRPVRSTPAWLFHS